MTAKRTSCTFRGWLLWLATAALLLPASPVAAIDAEPAGLDRLLGLADLIVWATVERVEAETLIASVHDTLGEMAGALVPGLEAEGLGAEEQSIHGRQRRVGRSGTCGPASTVPSGGGAGVAAGGRWPPGRVGPRRLVIADNPPFEVFASAAGGSKLGGSALRRCQIRRLTR